MKLLNYRKAIIDLRKLREYCLNPEHPVGKYKARDVSAPIFTRAVGIAYEQISPTARGTKNELGEKCGLKVPEWYLKITHAFQILYVSSK